MTTDLFGAPAEKPRKPGHIQPRGGADRPGTGPAGETCGSCRHLVRTGRSSGRTYPKCALTRAAWTHGPRSDVKIRFAACSKWEPRPS